MITDYHAKYIAYELTRVASRDGLDRLSMALFDANVDLNPHQIEAALFAMRSPVTKGVILADEVGLGKTIEASLVLCQLWAERKRRLLVICPASIRMQWASELEEKFNLPCLILDGKTFDQRKKSGIENPFEFRGVVICSYNFVARAQDDIKAVGWDLVVIDEAHKLRNAHRPSNRTGQAIQWATDTRRKILLTATPLQNSLLELYGMTSVIDDQLFGDPSAFRTLYAGVDRDLTDLRQRLSSFCKRTLRKDVLEYVQYTERRPLLQYYTPSAEEQHLYSAISEFLSREDTFSIPSMQRTLLTLRLRKILASSSHAIVGTLQIILERLLQLKEGVADLASIERKLQDDDFLDEDFLDELEEPSEDEAGVHFDFDALEAEIQEVQDFITLAKSIKTDSKASALLKALDTGFAQLQQIGAPRKALVFTESKRTQEYLAGFLAERGYEGRIVCFNGSNSDEFSRSLTKDWTEEQRDSGRVTGLRDVDARSAIIDHFRDKAEIMVATEAAAEGVNLQFCSLVINYDLPWNPQRIEQRIGRCHRYGQKHDVVVVNFVNELNEADKRTFELLEEKFNLFSGVFGASDQVLGSLESGVDIERRILEIYNSCRTVEEIERAFQTLREELDASIQSRMAETQQLLLEFFDEEIHERLRLQLEGTKERLDRFGRMFWRLTKHALAQRAEFDDTSLTFRLQDSPVETASPGTYHLISKTRENIEGEFLYRLSHPLGEHVIDDSKSCHTQPAHVRFDVTSHPAKISVIEELRGQSGWLRADRLVIESFEHEEYLLLSGIVDGGKALHQEVLEKLFQCDGNSVPCDKTIPVERLDAEAIQHHKATMHRSFEQNNVFMTEERERLEKWAEDLVLAAEKELRDTKAQIRETNRLARNATTTEEQHELQTKIRDLEQRQRRQRQRIFEVEDEIIAKRDKLIESLARRMKQRTEATNLFTIRWSVV
jgi:ERCC4-related helicase